MSARRAASAQAVSPVGLTGLPGALSERVLAACAVPMVILESRGSGCLIRYANPAFACRTGYSLAEMAVMGWNGLLLGSGGGRDFEQLCAAVREQREIDLPLCLHDKNGATVSVTLHVAPLEGRDAGAPSYSVGVLRERTADTAYVRRLEREAHYDPLTGLPNRRLLAGRAQRAVAQAQRVDQPFGVALIDLDDFKLVNDTLGHAAGDDVLCTVGARLAHDLRAGDFVARVGGDEFVLLLQEPSDDFPLAAVIERVRRRIEQPMHLHGKSFTIACSIGLAIFPADGEDLDTLLKHADRAMYREKGRRRPREPLTCSLRSAPAH